MPSSHSQARDASWEFVPSQPVPCFSGIRSKRGLEPCDAAAMEGNSRFHEQMHLPAKRVCLRDFNGQHFEQHVTEELPGCLKDSPPSQSSSLSNCNSSRVRLPAQAYLPSMVDGYHNNYNNMNMAINNNNNNVNNNSSGCLQPSTLLPPITENKSLEHLSNSDNNNNSNDDLMMEEDDNNDNTATPSTTTSIATSNHNNHHHIVNNTTTSGSVGIACSNGHYNQNSTSTDAESNMAAVTMETESTSEGAGVDMAERSHDASSAAVAAASSSPPRFSNGVFCGYSTCSGLRPSPVSGRAFCHCYASWRGMYGMEGDYLNDYY